MSLPSPPESEAEAVIVDLGVGNLRNLARALAAVGGRPAITTDPAAIAAARCLLLPGVGAFRPPREALRGEIEAAVRAALAAGAKLLGICVGYQLLFDRGEEYGDTAGLGLLTGTVRRLPAERAPLPHIGWNRLHDLAPHPLLAGLPEGGYVYFVHSYAPSEVPAGSVLASATHGRTFAAVAARGRVAGTQFHPEKSGTLGLRLLRNFLDCESSALAGWKGGA